MNCDLSPTFGTPTMPSLLLTISYVGLSAVTFLLLTPYYIWCCYLLYQHWDKQYFVKRRPFLVVIQLGIAFIFLIGNAPANTTLLLVPNHNFTEKWLLIYFFIFIPLIIFNGTIFLNRIWLLYYDMQLSQLMKNHNWRMAINPTIESNNWFLNPRNQRLFGKNGKFLFIIGLCFTVFETGIFLIFTIIFKWVLVATMGIFGIQMIKVSN